MALPFPATGIVTTFDDPPENPLSEGGAWRRLSGARPPMRKAGGEATDSIHGDPNYSVWVQTTMDTTNGSPIECWGCIDGGQLGAALETWRVSLWLEPYDATYGYLAYYGGAIGKQFALRRYNGGFAGGQFVDIASSGGGYPQKLGIRINGNNIECWAEYSGVWSLQCSVSDTNYRGKFYGSISVEDPTAGGLSFDCFGLGTKNRTQIYRLIRGNP